MWEKQFIGGVVLRPWRTSASRCLSSNMSPAVDSVILRSLKEHFLDISKMNPPPRIDPPSPFSIVRGALDGNGPVLTRAYDKEEISLSVMRLNSIVPGDGGDDEDAISQLLLHVNVVKPEQAKSLHFLCGLYPDALGIHSVSMWPKLQSPSFPSCPSTFSGPLFEELDEKMRDAFHGYIEERGVNENLFDFLRAWLYVKEHRSLLRWFKTTAKFIHASNVPAAQPASDLNGHHRVA